MKILAGRLCLSVTWISWNGERLRGYLVSPLVCRSGSKQSGSETGPRDRAHRTGDTADVFGALEFNNAARSLVFQSKLDPTGLGRMQRRMLECLETSILRRTPLPVYQHYEEGEMLSASLTARFGVRTLDLLHVAAARC